MIFYNTETDPEATQKLLNAARAKKETDDISSSVASIIKDVRENGDNANIRYAKKFDGVDIAPENFYIDLAKINADDLPLSEKETSAIKFAFKRVYEFALKTKPQDSARERGGNYVAQKYVPYDSVACYVPSGAFPLISTVLHTCAFVKAAGVKDITIITPCKKDGIHPAILYGAKIIGVNRILQLGGVYGIASAAFGTATVKPVQFIAGPGNAYVTEAKKQVFGQVNIDMLAGPSEIMVIADDTANADFVAADLLSQAEHGTGLEQAVLATTSQTLFDTIESKVAEQRKLLPESASTDRVIKTGMFIIKAQTLEECAEICNAYAPEHVEILTENPEKLEPSITAAGAIMMGPWTPEPIGDFVAGASHVLPTGGAAKIFSGLNTSHFMRKISLQHFDKETLSGLREAAETFAEMESLSAHGRSVSIRFQQ
ncbi:MAG TPA: histidinol dehydrogenase [Alphaproteobacteria bacterium]|nr:histidinol dehydrogenase [Alphaproteobacteria bacterium]HNS44579.1 histidinol dehydrogenase [Alphaproteobacteria bacterium]